MGPERRGRNIQSFPPPSISCPWVGSKGKGDARDVDNSLTEEPKKLDQLQGVKAFVLSLQLHKQVSRRSAQNSTKQLTQLLFQGLRFLINVVMDLMSVQNKSCIVTITSKQKQSCTLGLHSSIKTEQHYNPGVSSYQECWPLPKPCLQMQWHISKTWISDRLLPPGLAVSVQSCHFNCSELQLHHE